MFFFMVYYLIDKVKNLINLIFILNPSYTPKFLYVIIKLIRPWFLKYRLNLISLDFLLPTAINHNQITEIIFLNSIYSILCIAFSLSRLNRISQNMNQAIGIYHLINRCVGRFQLFAIRAIPIRLPNYEGRHFIIEHFL